MSTSEHHLEDNQKRRINYLRLSVTDRCNLRCQYCMPEQGVPSLDHRDILTYEELLRLARVALALGVSKIRVTGGEPLVRKGIVDFIARLAELPGLDDLGLTTNGIRLADYAPALKAAGLHRVNVSLDTLREDRFRSITRRGDLAAVCRGLTTAESAGLLPIKINTVIMRDVNIDEVPDFARLTLEHPFTVRFIEFMPVGTGNGWDRSRLVPGDEILRIIRSRYPLQPVAPDSPHSSAVRMFTITGSAGKIGLISPLSSHFCRMCNRIRITPDGRLKTCLFNDMDIDLRTRMRQGIDDAQLTDIIRDTVSGKPSGHNFSPSGYRKCNANMSQIGG